MVHVYNYKIVYKNISTRLNKSRHWDNSKMMSAYDQNGSMYAIKPTCTSTVLTTCNT